MGSSASTVEQPLDNERNIERFSGQCPRYDGPEVLPFSNGHRTPADTPERNRDISFMRHGFVMSSNEERQEETQGGASDVEDTMRHLNSGSLHPRRRRRRDGNSGTGSRVHRAKRVSRDPLLYRYFIR